MNANKQIFRSVCMKCVESLKNISNFPLLVSPHGRKVTTEGRFALQVRTLSSINENTNEPDTDTWDIIISGGGMVGSALACSLGHSKILSHKKILLLETTSKTAFSFPHDKYSNRVCALNPGTRKLLESFGAWDKICNFRMKAVKKMQVWESCSDAMIVFQQPEMVKDIAYIVENDIILKSLTDCLHSMQNRVTVFNGVKAIEYKFTKADDSEDDGDGVLVYLQDGRRLKTKLLIGADGGNSIVRQKMNIRYVGWKYNQKGIVATLRLSEPTENVVAWQRFLPSGPIALLPLTDELCSLVWTVSLPMADELLKASEEEFIDALNSALWDDSKKNTLAESAISSLNSLLSIMSPVKGTVRQLPPSIFAIEENSRAAFPLSLGHATEYVAQRVALIGDAAHRVHPLAGQGVNLGFGDVDCLREVLEESVYNGNDIGAIDPLLKYESKRQRHIVPIMAAIDCLNRLYGTELTPFVLMRTLGLQIVDSISPLKERLMEYASS